MFQILAYPSAHYPRLPARQPMACIVVASTRVGHSENTNTVEFHQTIMHWSCTNWRLHFRVGFQILTQYASVHKLQHDDNKLSQLSLSLEARIWHTRVSRQRSWAYTWQHCRCAYPGLVKVSMVIPPMADVFKYMTLDIRIAMLFAGRFRMSLRRHNL